MSARLSPRKVAKLRAELAAWRASGAQNDKHFLRRWHAQNAPEATLRHVIYAAYDGFPRASKAPVPRRGKHCPRQHSPRLAISTQPCTHRARQ